MKKDFSASILKKIRAKNITPRERSYFFAKTILHVLLGIAFLALGMISVALVWHLIQNFAFVEFILDRPQVLIKLFWFGVPLFWIFLSIVLWIVTEQVVRRTDRAYRIPFWGIGIMVFFVQILGGITLEQSRIGEKTDLMFEKRIEWYQGAERMNDRIERMQERGFLVGIIFDVPSERFILLQDVTGKKWEVELSPERRMPPLELKTGIKLGMMGEITGENSFRAFSWKPARGRPMDRRTKESLLEKEDGRIMRPPMSNQTRNFRERN